MSYFSQTFITFFKELSKNNTSEWFNENRKTYEKEVKKPFADFVEEMIARIQKYDPEVQIKPADAIMRINKDIRFSKDKTPYNTHVGANISAYGKKDKSYPGFYIQFSHEGISIYGGAYMVENTTLEHIRNCIAGNLKGFVAVCNDKVFKEKYGTIQGEQNKQIPPAFQAIAQQEPLIANKQFFYTTSLKPDLIISDKLPEKLMDYYLAGKKMNDFLKGAWKR